MAATKSVAAKVTKVAAGKHPTVDLLWERARQSSAEFIEQHLETAMLFKNKDVLHHYAIKHIPKDGMVLEFGVRSGTSINQFADIMTGRGDKRTLFGFDSFEGLSEKWVGASGRPGTFSLKGQLPPVRDNVTLIKGWIDDTLPKFLEENPGPIAFINVDTDTVSPCRTILELCKPRLIEGTVILFDELLSYPGWKQGEFLALQEQLSTDAYEFEAFSGYEAMIRIKRGKPSAKAVSAKPVVVRAREFSELSEITNREEIASFAPEGAIGVELGVASGSFSERLLATGRFGHFYSIDMWAGDRGHDVNQYKKVISRLQKYRDRSTIIKLRFDEALDLFPDDFFDFIYIDGYAHTGQNDGQTLLDWWPKLKRGGIFSGDDYAERFPKVIKEVDAFAHAHGLQIHVHRPRTVGDKQFQQPSWITRKP